MPPWIFMHASIISFLRSDFDLLDIDSPDEFIFIFFSIHAEMERTDFIFSFLIVWKACSVSNWISFRTHLLLSVFLFFLFTPAENKFSPASISSASFIPWSTYNCLLFSSFFKSLILTSISLSISLWVAILLLYSIGASFYI